MSARFQLTLVLTHACNLACGYCSMGDHHGGAMSRATAESALDWALARGRPLDLRFFGGEPLAAYARLVETARRARAMAPGVRLQVTTNATLLDAARARTLGALGVHVAVSLDGVREAHDAGRPRRGGASSFDAALRGVEALRDAGLTFDAVAVVTPDNVRRLGASVRFLDAIGARRVVLNPAYEAPWGDDDLAAWEAELVDLAGLYEGRMREGAPLALAAFERKLRLAVKGASGPEDRCGLGRSAVTVAPSGRLYPCERLVGEDRDDRFAIGRLETGVDAASLERFVRDEPSCDGCAEAFRCGSFCACANVAETGSPGTPGGVQCWYEQTTARLADDLGRRLVASRSTSFASWAYGAPRGPAGGRPPRIVAAGVGRRRLPLVGGVP